MKAHGSLGRFAPTHGASRTRLYNTWAQMKKRCNPDTTNPQCFHWAKNGIRVCSEWKQFEAFREWAISSGYREGLTLDRINGKLGYSPDNCRWATALEQMRNRRDNRNLELRGVVLPLRSWARELGIGAATIRQRLKRGWSVELALTISPKAITHARS